jgi:class 3 adenylate cyclase
MEPPPTRYVSVHGADVAYQVVGDGPIDLLFAYGIGSDVERWWEIPEASEALARLASFSRLIFLDQRGTGASDAVPDGAFHSWEEWAEDITAVLDAVQSHRAAVLAVGDAGPLAMRFTAMHPERVSALILVNSSARILVAEDYPFGLTQEEAAAFVESTRALWGTPEWSRLVNPGLAADEGLMRRLARTQRGAATPSSAALQIESFLRMDLRPLLPLIKVPTLVLHLEDSPLLPIEHGRYLADHITGAKLISIPGADIGILEPNMVDQVAEFLTGARPAEVDRVLATVLFTDIVDSTTQAAAKGDRAWRSLLDKHDATVRELLARHRGTEINTTGDGFLASFDGPARAIRCARAVVDAADRLGVKVRAGIHTGECEVRGDDLGGLSVHIASRVVANAEPGEVLVSGTVRDLVVGTSIRFADRGEHSLKGVPGSWRLFAVEGE